MGECYLLIPAHPGSPGQMAVKSVVCVCVYWLVGLLNRIWQQR